ncbi:MAG: hypothetical protein IKE68_08885, partial [Solobacterium sp.]|nr:hypothetical protein [Solobacterium sp.]
KKQYHEGSQQNIAVIRIQIDIHTLILHQDTGGKLQVKFIVRKFTAGCLHKSAGFAILPVLST